MISRQLPVVLQLIFERCEVSDDGFSFLTLLLVGYIGDAAVQIINGTSLYERSISQGLYCDNWDRMMHTRMTGQRSWAETEAKLDLSEVRYCAAEGKAGLVWAAESWDSQCHSRVWGSCSMVKEIIM